MASQWLNGVVLSILAATALFWPLLEISDAILCVWNSFKPSFSFSKVSVISDILTLNNADQFKKSLNHFFIKLFK